MSEIHRDNIFRITFPETDFFFFRITLKSWILFVIVSDSRGTREKKNVESILRFLSKRPKSRKSLFHVSGLQFYKDAFYHDTIAILSVCMCVCAYRCKYIRSILHHPQSASRPHGAARRPNLLTSMLYGVSANHRLHLVTPRCGARTSSIERSRVNSSPLRFLRAFVRQRAFHQDRKRGRRWQLAYGD